MVDDIEEFEELVLSQQSASQPWTPVTDYSFEARKAIEGNHPHLIKTTFHPKLVVDVGCGRDAILLRLLEDEGVFGYGIDPNVEKDYANIGDLHVYKRDICDIFSFSEWEQASLVICREVLEHLTLREARIALTNLCRLSSRFVYITTRFSSEHDILRVETSDDLDPTHITLPAKDLYRLLLTLEGFKRRADLEDAMDHQKKGRCLVYERA